MPTLLAPVFEDRVTSDGLKMAGVGKAVEVAVTDHGSGLSPDKVSVLINGGLLRERAQVRTIAEGEYVVSFIPSGNLSRNSNTVEITVEDMVGNTAVLETSLVAPPDFGFSALSVYPNPARNFAKIRYKLNVDADELKVSVYDVSGRKVTTLYGDGSSAASQEVRWDLTDRRGRLVSNGVYIARISAKGATGSSRETVKLAVLR